MGSQKVSMKKILVLDELIQLPRWVASCPGTNIVLRWRTAATSNSTGWLYVVDNRYPFIWFITNTTVQLTSIGNMKNSLKNLWMKTWLESTKRQGVSSPAITWSIGLKATDIPHLINPPTSCSACTRSQTTPLWKEKSWSTLGQRLWPTLADQSVSSSASPSCPCGMGYIWWGQE